MKYTFDDLTPAPTSEQKTYLRTVYRRARRSTTATRARVVTIQVSWIIVLVAGASASLAGAFDNGVAAAGLGFIVVVFQGLDQIFKRTAKGSELEDRLRRGLQREQRRLMVNGGPYADADAPIDLFITQCERLIDDYDEAMTDYYVNLTTRTE